MDHNLEHDGVHVVVDCEILDDPLQPELVRGVTTHSRQCTSNSQLDCTSKKESRLSQMGDALKAWAKASKARIETSNTRTEALLAKVERYKSGTSNKATSAKDIRTGEKKRTKKEEGDERRAKNGEEEEELRTMSGLKQWEDVEAINARVNRCHSSPMVN
ncbi:hypothetical protein CK203_098051 [Vitis vinifera]|uniref:Uncharacterized protein n=1 Tax=Vitis vinifera TaxID=29760 RepID=A0A438CRZ8_VITVI|nr:hypothetical protein CK203_098051 [Vitis vinifera]